MPNHAHLLIHPNKTEYDITLIKKAIKQSVSKRMVSVYKRQNPNLLKKLYKVKKNSNVSFRFWQEGGGYDRNIHTPKALRAVINYIHENPVRAGLSGSACDWKWSSANAYEGGKDIPLKVDICEAFF